MLRVHDTHIQKMYIKFFLKGVMTKKWDKNHRNKTISWSSVNNASQPCLDIRIPWEALKTIHQYVRLRVYLGVAS